MTDFIYSAEGYPKAFRLGSDIYALSGAPIGRIHAEKAYRLDGEYVGALVNKMILDKPGVSRRSLPPRSPPDDTLAQISVDRRRPVGEALPDVFDLLIASTTSL